MLDLTNVELFENLLALQVNDGVVDLHNDYDCKEIVYDSGQRILICFFKGKDEVVIRFEGVTIAKFNFFLKRTIDSGTLNNFYRGRFEQDGNLFEYAKDGSGYYYLEFEEGDILELHARTVLLYRNM